MRIGIVAGEASGDLLGAGLVLALRRRHPELVAEGVAGPAMLDAGCEMLAASEELAVMGLIEPLRHIPRLMRLRRMLIDRWSDNPPDVVIGIDSPDFNLGLEKRLRMRGVKTVHYVSPSVWAWRQGRVKTIRRAVNRVLCLLPFEKRFFDQHNVPADFVGHPMAERISPQPDAAAARKRLGLGGGPLVAVLPGSRRGEVERLGEPFIQACRLLADDSSEASPAFVAPMATPAIRELFRTLVEQAGMAETIQIIDGDSETALTAADVALMSSGTATLEAALLATPLVAAYKVAPLTYAIAKGLRLLKTPYVALPNLLTDEPLVPELTQHAATPEALAAEVRALLNDEPRRQEIVRKFSGLRPMLARNADERAADSVLSVIAGAS